MGRSVGEFISGYCVGTVDSDDEIEVIYIQDDEQAEVVENRLFRVVE